MPPKRKRAGRRPSDDSVPTTSPPKPKRTRRGGPHAAHRLKDEDKTGTHWDTESYVTVKNEAQERGLWSKDMPKKAAIRLLAEDDKRAVKEKKVAEKKAVENRKRTAEERKRKEEEVRQKKEERQRRIDEGLIDPDEVEAEDAAGEEYTFEGVGQLIEDTSEDETTSSDSDRTETPISPLVVHQRLRIFEWPFPGLPSPYPPKTPTSAYSAGSPQENIPVRFPYAVLMLKTSETKEYVELPGRNYPPAVRGDFVPMLSPDTIDAARNGVLIRELRKAIIESGQEWNKRTRVQGWNGRMYLAAIPKKELQPLLEDEEIRQPEEVTEGASNASNRNKKGLALDLNSKFPHSDNAVCYLPAYLDYPYIRQDDEKRPRNLNRIFFVRFPGMDLPQYYFWTRRKEWGDPTTPNPEYREIKEEDDLLARVEEEERNRLFEEQRNRFERPSVHRRLPYPISRSQERVRKPTPAPRRTVLPTDYDEFAQEITSLEEELYETGLSGTLHRLREDWLRRGRRQQWEHITDKLLHSFPSGKLPDAPPVHGDMDGRDIPLSVAEKIATLQHPSPSAPSPLLGDEPWTRDDDAYWDIIDLPEDVAMEDIQTEDFQAAVQRELLSEEMRNLEVETPVLPSFPNEPQSLPRTFEEFEDWLQNTSPVGYIGQYVAEAPRMETPVNKALRTLERERWEKLFQKHVEDETAERDPYHIVLPSPGVPVTNALPRFIEQIEDMPVEELKFQLYSMMSEKLKEHQYCRVCLEPFERTDEAGIVEHYQMHQTQAGDQCPFCSMKWTHLSSQLRGSHIFEHDYPTSTDWTTHDLWSPTPFTRRRTIHTTHVAKELRSLQPTTPIATRRRRTAAARIETSTPRIVDNSYPYRASKVTFSPRTVEKRTGYNDHISSPAPPRRSSLKYASTEKELSVTTSLAATSRKKGGVAKSPKTPTKRTIRKPSAGQAEWHLPSEESSPRSPSPVLHVSRRKPADHPDAAFKPRNASTSMDETVTPTKKKSVKKTTIRLTAPTPPKTKNAPATPLTPRSRKRRASLGEETYEDELSSSPATPPLVLKAARKRKITDLTYHNPPTPSSSSSAPSPVLKKRRRGKVVDATYRAPATPFTSEPSTPDKGEGGSARKAAKKVLGSEGMVAYNDADLETPADKVFLVGEVQRSRISGKPVVKPKLVAVAKRLGVNVHGKR